MLTQPGRSGCLRAGRGRRGCLCLFQRQGRKIIGCARRRGHASPLGRRLDSLGRLTLYLGVETRLGLARGGQGAGLGGNMGTGDLHSASIVKTGLGKD